MEHQRQRQPLSPTSPVLAAKTSFSYDDTPPRCNEPAKFLPIVFVVFLMCIIYSIFVFVHCAWLLQDTARKPRAYVELGAVHVLTFMLVACYIRCIRTGPGEIPGDEEWVYKPRDVKSGDSSSEIKDRLPRLDTKEMKRSGERRHCKWCQKFKPDRCHHCRACRVCVLKMDHHCPWINNCVGFRNHKYFFLLIFYTAFDCNVIAWSMLESVRMSYLIETSFVKMWLVVFGFTLSGFLAALVTVFFGFHIWLACKGMTTIEFCEKAMKTGDYNKSPYNEGGCMNAKAMLGPNVLLWLLPLSPPSGDGISFVTENSRLTLTNDPEVGKTYVRRKSHRPAQREDTPREQPRPDTRPKAEPLKLASVAAP
jgi:hypothetical protein